MSSTTPVATLNDFLTTNAVRALGAAEVGLPLPGIPGSPVPPLPEPDPLAEEYEGPRIGGLAQLIEAATDPDLKLAAQLLDDGFAGIIYAGLPGTGKSRTARRVALWLAQSDPSRYKMIQFHPSYQYEDFMQGFVPREDGEGFNLQDKHFVEMCNQAEKAYPKLHVLVVDELSRVDPSRVFGEALGFIEQDKKGQKFKLASGQELVVPDNLVILATMNDRDRGVDEVDIAFERRFARVEVLPSSIALEDMLAENGVDAELRQRLGIFFNYLLKHVNPEVHLGHGYFARVRDLASLERLWNYQLLHLMQRAFRAVPNESELAAIKQRWQRVVTAPSATIPAAEPSAESEAEPGAELASTPS